MPKINLIENELAKINNFEEDFILDESYHDDYLQEDFNLSDEIFIE